YLIDTQQPFTEGDASFLGIVRRYIESVFIVQTKIDLWRMREGEREAWQSAAQRIVAQAALHAPGTPVFPLSAREYAEGLLTGDETLIAQSRFREFFGALDASLVATTGRSRLRRAAAEARRVATRAADALAFDAAALETDEAALRARRADAAPALDAFEAAARDAQGRLGEAGAALATATRERGERSRTELALSLIRTFDVADIARLRDRAKLHILVDDVVATVIGRFAADTAEVVAKRLREEAKRASAVIVALARDADRAPLRRCASGRVHETRDRRRLRERLSGVRYRGEHVRRRHRESHLCDRAPSRGAPRRARAARACGSAGAARARAFGARVVDRPRRGGAASARRGRSRARARDAHRH